jgi:hypothetical protein
MPVLGVDFWRKGVDNYNVKVKIVRLGWGDFLIQRLPEDDAPWLKPTQEHSTQNLSVEIKSSTKERKSTVKKLLLLFIPLFVFGCTGVGPSHNKGELLHENNESRLLTEEEFMDRASQAATLVYERMRIISDAANLYAADNAGKLPSGNFNDVETLLMEGGYLKVWPALPPFAFTNPVSNKLRYSTRYGDMDGSAPHDDVLYAQGLKIEVCEAFARRYSSFGPNDIIHDYQANGDKAPGATLGKHMKVYAMIWEMATRYEYCDIVWVMQYNDASKRSSKRVPVFR